MKDGNEGHGMNKKYEKFKLAVGTTFAFFILVAVMGIAFVQNRYADENILEDELLEIQGDEKFHYVEPRHKTEVMDKMWEIGSIRIRKENRRLIATENAGTKLDI